MAKDRISIMVEKDLLQQIDDRAHRRGVSRSAWIQGACEILLSQSNVTITYINASTSETTLTI